jgi:hypothetical protein
MVSSSFLEMNSRKRLKMFLRILRIAILPSEELKGMRIIMNGGEKEGNFRGLKTFL